MSTATATSDAKHPSSTTSRTDAKLLAHLGPFLLVWVLLPGALRAATLVRWLGDDLLSARALDLLIGLGVGLTHDAFIALQALTLLLITRQLFGSQRRGWLIFGAINLALVATYYLIDFLLFWHAGLRMSAAFLHFLFDADTFLDSAGDVGVHWLLLLIGVICTASGFALRAIRGPLRAIRLSWTLALTAILISGAAVGSAFVTPGEILYRSSNVVLNDEIEALHTFFDIEDPLLQLAREADAHTLWVPEPINETSSYPDPKRYPLLRDTTAFHGPTHFDIRIEPDERPHVIILVMESFRALDLGAYGSTLGASPNFDRLTDQGVFFTDFHATGPQTSRALVSLLAGVMPKFSEYTVQGNRTDIRFIGLPEIFRRNDYHTAYISNGELDFENMEYFLRNRAYDTIVGEPQMLERYPDADRFSWGLHDVHLMDYALEWLEDKHAEGTPTFSTLFTITNHHPWEIPSGWVPPPFYDANNDIHQRFIKTLHYSDHALGRFVDDLRERGLADDTILLITADTSQAMGEHDNFNITHNLFDENVRIPLLILADGRVQPTTVSEIGSLHDLLPTLMDVMGFSGPHHAIGTSLRRLHPDHSVFFASPHALKYWGLRHRNHKYFYTFKETSQPHHLYDLEADPGELHNLAEDRPDLVLRYQLAVGRMHRLFQHLYEEENEHFAPK